MRTYLLLPLLLGACSSAIERTDWTSSGFRSATGSVATLGASLSDRNTGSVSSSAGTAYFVTGLDNGAKALAALGTDVNVGATLASDMRFSGPWRTTVIRNINVTETTANSGFLTGQPSRVSGTILLTADVSSGTLSGSDGALRVSGTMSGKDISGSVSFEGLTGRLDGRVGQRGAVGIFHGNNDDVVYSGGFSVD